MNIQFLKEKFQSKSMSKSIVTIGLFRLVNVALNFLIVPLTINYVKPDIYGVWLVLLSIISWFAIFDIGLGNGLRNNLTISISNNDMVTAKKYVSTTYILLALISVCLFILMVFIAYYIDWNTVLKIKTSTEDSLYIVIFFLIFSFSIRFILQLITTIFYALHQPEKPEIINCISSIITLITILILKNFAQPKLLYLVFSISFPPIIVLFLFTIYFFSRKANLKIKPSINYFEPQYIKRLLDLGVKFFILQISVLVSFTLSDFLILKFLDSSEVTKYNIAYKYFTIITIVSSVICAPLWSAFTKSYFEKDMNWIKTTIIKLMKIYVLICLGAFTMLIVSNWFYKFWTRIDLKIPFTLSLFICLYMLVAAWNGIFVAFINGVGKLKLQVYLSVIPIIFNIPLSYFLIVKMDWGVTGMSVCLFLFNFISSCILTYQAYLIIIKKDTGIWSK
ncbi:lipopolysaccharide biosynthesis protein [Empedobacter sp.]|uniref:lipopolysaccharide biosynthesis protein n=1 Tax=Empedobacter sp. TaxID=1927715 RepID=UPI0028B04B16|nr:oligosaccharide flippase family protein [Empedobacter sp.]